MNGMSWQTNQPRHSRAACVVGAFAPYNHGVLLASAGGNPVVEITPHGGTKPESCPLRAFFVLLDSRLRGNDGLRVVLT
jgi:hypothetical protein